MPMEMDPSTSMVAKKLFSILRAVVFMVRKGFSKNKIMVDIHLMLKRGKLAGKAIGNLMLQHYSAITCRYDDAQYLSSFVSPREYEFSCSNTPANNLFFHKRNKHHQNSYHSYRSRRHDHHSRIPRTSYGYDDVVAISAVQKVLEMLNNSNDVVSFPGSTVEPASPMIVLPGFGMSPAVRPLRVTDSPFPIKDDGNSGVDVAAEEFINSFYKNLRSQKTRAALESPYHYGMWG